jgi:hypothetical protein
VTYISGNANASFTNGNTYTISWVFNGLDGLNAFSVITESTTSRTLALTDASKYIQTTNASAVTIALPNQATVSWSNDTEIMFEQGGAGQISFSAGTSVTINSSTSNLTSRAQYSVVALKRISSNVWTLFGDIT